MANAPDNFSAWLAKIKHTPALQSARLFLGGYSSYVSAKKYYELQKPFLETAMRETHLHPYWRKSQEDLEHRLTWQDMVVGRMSGMLQQLKNSQHDDFKVEKDKCEMYGFFERNGLPFVPLLGMWDQKDSLLSYLEQLRGEVAKHDFPLWLKSCHLTQIKREDLRDPLRFEKLREWVTKKWDQKPNDDARAWSSDAKQILDTLKPRFLIQTSYAPPYGDAVGFPKKAPVELKIEVLWGRAYLANICDYEAYALRDGTIERWDTSVFSRIAHAPVTDPEKTKEVKWLQDEGHLEKAYALAEKVCRSMLADQVRVDIFVRPGEPDAVMVNEISISPGALYKWHAQFMAETWRRGHAEKLFTPAQTDKRVYEEGPKEGKLSTGEKWFEPQDDDDDEEEDDDDDANDDEGEEEREETEVRSLLMD
eukprot:CAMPEP_0184506474 /NCGR_PEP_ID=MMETSP0113_2-20130426/53518_1 /TAXON_ID=91329 /ORGANISM="Norrisiella sphaerica, Strain BC52" /LENGTH=420 /DNA_ID=CAMNT_0026896193 /DNA_START=156 /DNA_END=1420 /DNA_ORIENTATION=-